MTTRTGSGRRALSAGQSNSDFFVLIDGEVEVVRDDESQELVVVYTPGQFIGELGLITGQHAVLTARSTESGMALVIPRDSFRRLMATKPTISDDILVALIARRETVRTTSAAQAIQIIGSRFSREALALRRSPPGTASHIAGSISNRRRTWGYFSPARDFRSEVLQS